MRSSVSSRRKGTVCRLLGRRNDKPNSASADLVAVTAGVDAPGVNAALLPELPGVPADVLVWPGNGQVSVSVLAAGGWGAGVAVYGGVAGGGFADLDLVCGVVAGFFPVGGDGPGPGDDL